MVFKRILHWISLFIFWGVGPSQNPWILAQNYLQICPFKSFLWEGKLILAYIFPENPFLISKTKIHPKNMLAAFKTKLLLSFMGDTGVLLGQWTAHPPLGFQEDLENRCRGPITPQKIHLEVQFQKCQTLGVWFCPKTQETCIFQHFYPWTYPQSGYVGLIT